MLKLFGPSDDAKKIYRIVPCKSNNEIVDVSTSSGFWISANFVIVRDFVVVVREAVIVDVVVLAAVVTVVVSDESKILGTICFEVFIPVADGLLVLLKVSVVW